MYWYASIVFGSFCSVMLCLVCPDMLSYVVAVMVCLCLVCVCLVCVCLVCVLSVCVLSVCVCGCVCLGCLLSVISVFSVCVFVLSMHAFHFLMCVLCLERMF